MTVARTFFRRFWVGVILIPGFLKLAVARIIPTASTSTSDISPTGNPKLKTGRVLRFVGSTGSVHYGLEATGVFPYVRVVAIQQSSAPVPVEVATVREVSNVNTAPTTGQDGRGATKKTSRSLTRRLQSKHNQDKDKPFCYPANSQSCLNCPQCCIICGSCSSCANCTGCTGCANCTC